MNTTAGHLSLDALLAYWMHESDPGATDAADEHLMRCDACGDALDELIALGEGVRGALRAGAVSVVTSAAFVERLAQRGVHVREYRLHAGTSVNCQVAPDDEVLVTRLQAPLSGVRRLDIHVRSSLEPQTVHGQQDVPFDAQRGEVVYLSRLDALRQLPAHSLAVTLWAVDPGGAREIGRYTFHHQP